MNREICLKCEHNIDLHKIEIIGNYEAVEISCKSEEEGYEICNCDAGFKKVAIEKKFTQMGA